ncbi:helix-turn-helix domain-containing protein [Virgibacillus soli]|uniref:Helix-turn-helix transcriptional regulator n=1 Tax=Paracerasibacillus soli TaxID=480284 RepID=A0ABU5CW99_9BACI|nr:helix-turn-helix transcriptional regulator [Virgibacillus soli]MDY0410126.1 helix-turn-helix transcriptional regulator [Virgibacillus soli]
MTFGEYVRNSRQRKNLSLREAARRAGISHPYLSQLETGKNTKPTPEVIKKIADGLELNYIELLEIAGYLEEAEREGLMKSAEEYRKHREKHGLKDVGILNEETIILDDIITAAQLNTEFVYSGEKLDLEEKIFIANVLRIILNNDIPSEHNERTKALDLIETLLK